MKIVVSNNVALNGGDAAILLAIIKLLRNSFGADTEIIAYDSQPEIASRYYPDIAFRKSLYLQLIQTPKIKYLERIINKLQKIANLPRFFLAAWCFCHKLKFVAKILLSKRELADINIYNSADVVVSTGGTYLVENYFLLPRIFDYQITLLLQRPLVFYTQSMGPFMQQSNRQVFAKIFNRALVILLRDELSHGYLKDLNIQGDNVHVSSDVVFSLANESDLYQAIYHTIPKNSCLKVAISVRYWSYFKQSDVSDGMENYKQAIAAVTAHIVEKYQAEVTYISTCQGIPEYWADDSKVAAEIINLLPGHIQQRVILNRNFQLPETILNNLKSYDIVIATRMHMAILALSAGTPVLPIAYEFKTQELFRRLGLGEWVQDIETTDTESIKSLFDKFIDELPTVRHSLFMQVAKERAQAIASMAIVKAAYEQSQ